MTKGCLIFAFNNETTNYKKLADACAGNISRHLSLPTTLVTNEPINWEHSFEQVIVIKTPASGVRHFVDQEQTVSWFNYNRYKAFDLTPYGQTIMLDADYIVASNQLATLFDSGKSFLCHTNSYDVTGSSNFDDLNYFGQFKMPMQWATVVYFDRSKQAELIFKSMQMIQENYVHFSYLYNFKKQPFRNDYALSIALNINNGHSLDLGEFAIPWKLAATTPEQSVERIGDDTYEIKFVAQRPQRVIVHGMDLHVMGKKDLQEIYES